MSGCWSTPSSSRPRRSGGCGRAGSGRGDSRTRPHGSSSSAGYGTPGSTCWSRSPLSADGRSGTMSTRSAAEATTTMDRTTVERTSEQDFVVTRTIDGPRDVVFEAWTDAELFRQWWVPKSIGVKLLSCEVDARVGGGYRLTFDTGTPEPMAFFGTYLEVTPPTRLVWTNEEGDEGTVVTTVTFEEDHGRTRLVIDDRYPSKEALDAAVASGATSWNPETFDQLDELLVSLGVSTRR